MREIVCSGVALVIASLVTLVARADERGPYKFEPVRASAKMSVASTDEMESSAFQSLSISPDGTHVALARLYGKVDIWSIGSGAKTATMRLAAGEDRVAAIALLGSPCVAVTAVGARLSGGPSRGATTHPIEIWECQSGKRVAAVRTADKRSRNDLVDLIPLPECGFVVASFTDRVAVIDIASSSLRPDLSKLFEEARVASTRSYPGVAPKGSSPRVILKLAASSGDGCVIFGAAHHYNAGANALVPAELYEFDLQAQRVRMVRRLPYDLAVKTSMGSPLTKLVVSPAGRYAAVSIQPLVPVWDGGVVVFADLSGEVRQEYFDGREMWTVSDLAFLSEDELLLGTKWMIYNTEAMVLDRRSKRLHTLCSTIFGEPDSKKGNPRAVAVNAKLDLVAVALRDEVRVFQYSRNATGLWEDRRCASD